MNSSKQFSLAMADMTLLGCFIYLFQLPPVGVAFLIFVVAVCRVVVEPQWFVAVALATGFAIAVWYDLDGFYRSDLDARINGAFAITMSTYFLFAIVYFALHYMDRFLKYVGDGLRQRDR